MWNYLKQKQTVMLAVFLLLASVGVVAITTMNKNGNTNKETSHHVDDELSEEDGFSFDETKDNYKEPKGVSKTVEPTVNEQNDTSMTNPGVVNTPMSFASLTTTSVMVELGPEDNENQIGLERAEIPIQPAKEDSFDQEVAMTEKTEKDSRSFDGAVSVPAIQDVNEEEEARRIEKARQAEEEARKAEEEARKLAEAEAEAKAKVEEATAATTEAEKVKDDIDIDDEEAREKAEAEVRKAEEEKAKTEEEAKQAEEEARKAKEEARRKAEEEARALAEVEALVQMLHSEPYEGNAYGGINTYPWQADCPDKQDYYVTYLDGLAIGGYVCECVSYAGWKAYEAWGIPLSWGNAYSWDDRAKMDAKFYVDNIPEAKSIGQIDGSPYGHVFWVESVNQDGSVNVTEYNNAYATQLSSGIYRYGDFGARMISASEAGKYNYIHLK